MKVMKTFRFAGIRLASVAFLLAAGITSLAAQTTDSPQVSKLMSDARKDSRQAADDAQTLDMYARDTNITWHTHADELNQMRGHVNDLGKVVKQLNDLESAASPWQQQAIERINPLLREMAAQLSMTIDRLNKDKNVTMPPYQDYVHANYDLASETANMVNDFVEYGQAKSRAEVLEHKLELPASDIAK